LFLVDFHVGPFTFTREEIDREHELCPKRFNCDPDNSYDTADDSDGHRYSDDDSDCTMCERVATREVLFYAHVDPSYDGRGESYDSGSPGEEGEEDEQKIEHVFPLGW